MHRRHSRVDDSVSGHSGVIVLYEKRIREHVEDPADREARERHRDPIISGGAPNCPCPFPGTPGSFKRSSQTTRESLNDQVRTGSVVGVFGNRGRQEGAVKEGTPPCNDAAPAARTRRRAPRR